MNVVGLTQNQRLTDPDCKRKSSRGLLRPPLSQAEATFAFALSSVPPSSTHRSHSAAWASLGIRQSPRGDRLTEPTFGPSGRQERLNWLAKNRRTNTRSQRRSSSGAYSRSKRAWAAR